MRRSRDHRDIAQANDVWREIARPLWQAGLCLCAGKGCLPLSGRRAVDLSVHSGRAWQDDTPLLDDGVFEVPLQSRCTTGPERRIQRWEHEHLLGPFRSVSTRARKPCVCAARPLSIHSAR